MNALKNKPANGPVPMPPPTLVTPAIVTPTPAQTQKQILYQKVKQNTEELAQSLKHERMKQGLTQRQLAAEAGVSQGSITRLESGLFTSLWMMMRVSSALGKTVIIN